MLWSLINSSLIISHTFHFFGFTKFSPFLWHSSLSSMRPSQNILAPKVDLIWNAISALLSPLQTPPPLPPSLSLIQWGCLHYTDPYIYCWSQRSHVHFSSEAGPSYCDTDAWGKHKSAVLPWYRQATRCPSRRADSRDTVGELEKERAWIIQRSRE